MTETFLKKIFELLPTVNKEIWDGEGEDFLNWLRTFKSRKSVLDMLEITDEKLTQIFNEKEGWLDDPIKEAPDITTRIVMEAVFTECVLRAGNELGLNL